MDKKFKVSYYDRGDPGQVYSDFVSAASPSEAKRFVESQGYALRGEPQEVESGRNAFSEFAEAVRSKFAVRTYDSEIETAFLKSFATGIRDYLPPAEALEKAKFKFGRSNRNVRSAIDELVEEERKGGIRNWFELFSKKEEMFSDSFLTAMKVACGLEANPVKIISNPVPPDKRGKEVEGYVEMTESMNKLKNEMVSSIVPPTIYFVLLLSMTLGVLVAIIPKFLQAFAKVRDVSKDDYTIVGNFTLLASEAAVAIGPYVLAILVVAAFAVTFLFRTNSQFRFALQRAMLKSPMLWDVLTVFYTKKVVSLWAMFAESGMTHSESLPSVASVVPFDPMRQELLALASSIHSESFRDVFRRLPEDERHFTETFYNSLESEADSGRYGRAFAEIIKNTEDMWDIDLSKYPKKLGAYIKYGGLLVASFFVLGLLIIVVKTIFNSV